MRVKKLILLATTHLLTAVVGFAIGIYTLPILIAPTPPTKLDIMATPSQAKYSAEFTRDLKDSDLFHWGEGTVSVGSQFITLMGKLSPGPDYRLYLSTQFVETEVDFNRLKNKMIYVGDVKTFENFAVDVPPGINPSDYNTVIVWCETFSEFITSAKYR